MMVPGSPFPIQSCIYIHDPDLASRHNRFWLAGAGQVRHWLCARCHPAPDGEEIVSLLADNGKEVLSGQAAISCIREEIQVPGPSRGGAGEHFRAANEAAWARLFDALGIEWVYEALEPDISRAIRYMPDFWLPGRLAWVEIKSEPPTPGEIRVARLLRRATGQRVYVLDGWPWPRSFGVSVFSEAGDFAVGRADWRLLALGNLLGRQVGEVKRAMERVRGGE